MEIEPSKKKRFEGLLKSWFEEIMKEIQGILALSYVFLIIIGMINEVFYYNAFGINIFEYSEILDFLIAPFKRPESIIFLLLALTVSFGSYLLDNFLEKRIPRMHNFINMGLAKKDWFYTYRIASIFVTFLILLASYAFLISEKRKEFLYKKSDSELEIILNSQENQSIFGNKIGANSKYIFLLDQQKEVQVIPIGSSIERIHHRNANKEKDEQ